MINRSSKPSAKREGGSPGILKKTKHQDEFLPQLTSPRVADNNNSYNPMPKGQVNIKMARDESRRLRKVPAAALAAAKNSPTPAGKKAKLAE